jgi:hypothetical protein
LTRRHFLGRLLILKDIVLLYREFFVGRNGSRFRNLFGAVLMLALGSSIALAVPNSGFLPQARIGHTVGDQWEPALTADGAGHVYVLYPQYLTVPKCEHCPVPTLILVVSNNNGTTWEAPREIAPLGTAQYDPQIMVDPADRRTVYAAWLQNEKRDVIVAKSVDFGQNWTVALAARETTDADKPVLAVRGPDVYVAYNHASNVRAAVSHDAGSSFTTVTVNPTKAPGWAQAGGATIDPAGNAYVSWAAYSRTPRGPGPVALYVSRSVDGGRTWNLALLDVSGAPPACENEADECGWAYLGAQIALSSDSAGTLYALWNSGSISGTAERILFSASTTGGATWTAKADVSRAVAGVSHAFPTIVAGAAGDVRIAWMDTRNSPFWNTYYRSSTNGGATWSSENRLSTFVPGFDYIGPSGFKFPFGDYFGMAIDSRGDTQLVWGEGLTYESPGSIWYTRGR